MVNKFENNECVKIFSKDYTFEIEFYKDNIEVLKELLNENKYFMSISKMNDELDSQNESMKYDRIINLNFSKIRANRHMVL